jgi:hypothetical protein
MATPTALGMLGLLLLFQVKHAVFDGPLQLGWMVKQKGFYGRPGGLIHAGLHGIGSFAVLLIFGIPAMLAIALSATDAVVHYHVDFGKETVVRRNGWTPGVPQFWWALTTDQMFHQVTYLALAAAVLRWS